MQQTKLFDHIYFTIEKKMFTDIVKEEYWKTNIFFIIILKI